MNILKEDIDKISSNLKIDTDIVNNIINDFDNILQPVIQQNYLSHLVSSIETIINEKIKEKLPQVYSKELIDLLFNYPYCKISFLVRDNIAKTQTASKYLNALADMGYLHRVKRGREVYFINENLLRILTKPQV